MARTRLSRITGSWGRSRPHSNRRCGTSPSSSAPKGIRVHAISPGPLATRAASGIPDFDALMARVAERAPARRLVTIDEVGAACVFLASPYAGAMTGDTIYIDGGYHILG